MRHFSPEQKLFLGVLLRAIADSQGDVAGIHDLTPERKAREREATRAEAAAWFEETTSVDPRTAEEVCAVLGLSRAKLAARLRAGRVVLPGHLFAVSSRAQKMGGGRQRRPVEYWAARRAAQRGAA